MCHDVRGYAPAGSRWDVSPLSICGGSGVGSTHDAEHLDAPHWYKISCLVDLAGDRKAAAKLQALGSDVRHATYNTT